jgi:hypothetical protein
MERETGLKKQAHISILNSPRQPLGVRRHQYLCEFERDEDAPEVHSQRVKNQTSYLSYRSTPR